MKKVILIAALTALLLGGCKIRDNPDWGLINAGAAMMGGQNTYQSPRQQFTRCYTDQYGHTSCTTW